MPKEVRCVHTIFSTPFQLRALPKNGQNGLNRLIARGGPLYNLIDYSPMLCSRIRKNAGPRFCKRGYLGN